MLSPILGNSFYQMYYVSLNFVFFYKPECVSTHSFEPLTFLLCTFGSKKDILLQKLVMGRAVQISNQTSKFELCMRKI